MKIKETTNFSLSGELRDKEQENNFKQYYWEQSKNHYFVSYNICCILLLFAGIFFDYHRIFYWGSANLLTTLRISLVVSGLAMFPFFYRKIVFPKAIEFYGFFLMLFSSTIIIALTLMTHGNSFTLMPGILIMTCSFYIVTPAPLLFAFISSTLLLTHYIIFFNYELVGFNAHVYMCFMLCAINIVLIYIKVIQARSQRSSFLAQEYLKELGQAKDTILSIIGHDLKNPLTIITNRIAILNKSLEKEDIDKSKQQVASIISASENLNHLLQNLLEWAISIKSTIKNQSHSEIQDSCSNAIDFCESYAGEKNISIVKSIAPHSFNFNESMIETVIRNILSNSIKYSYENSKIYVEGKLQGNQYLIRIKDQGVGISNELIKELKDGSNIFSKPGTCGEQGHGLGLRLVFHLLQSHQCEINICSTKEMGSDFSVFLPVS